MVKHGKRSEIDHQCDLYPLFKKDRAKEFLLLSSAFFSVPSAQARLLYPRAASLVLLIRLTHPRIDQFLPVLD